VLLQQATDHHRHQLPNPLTNFPPHQSKTQIVQNPTFEIAPIRSTSPAFERCMKCVFFDRPPLQANHWTMCAGHMSRCISTNYISYIQGQTIFSNGPMEYDRIPSTGSVNSISMPNGRRQITDAVLTRIRRWVHHTQLQWKQNGAHRQAVSRRTAAGRCPAADLRLQRTVMAHAYRLICCFYPDSSDCRSAVREQQQS
jgi:hypothetical protein